MAKKSLFSNSGNPLFRNQLLKGNLPTNQVLDADYARSDERMTTQGAVRKSFVLFVLLLASAVLSFTNPSNLFLWGGAIGGLVLVLVISFKPALSPILAPIYALIEGLFVGSVTAFYGGAFGMAVVFHAVTLTLALLFAMLFLYQSGIVRVTRSFRTGVAMATMGVFLVYLVNIVLRLFGIHIGFLHEQNWMGIGFSLLVVGIATLNLLVDFDNFDQGQRIGAPAFMEWFSAMGLLVTLVWLYVELLRLVALLSGRD
ncbi:MAG: hypothetical protein RLY31_2605 [Bacteroidota bacterium]|jgi:uncharacterized YccA/Bax inhibitor family protein